jgi:hypothetical protein
MAYLYGEQQEKLTRKNSSVTDVNQMHMCMRFLTLNTYGMRPCSADLKPQDHLHISFIYNILNTDVYIMTVGFRAFQSYFVLANLCILIMSTDLVLPTESYQVTSYTNRYNPVSFGVSYMYTYSIPL